MQVKSSATPKTMDPKNASQGVASPKKASAQPEAASKAKVADASKAPTNEQTSSYLKVVSRIESMVEKNELNEKIVKNFTTAMKVRLDDLSDQQKSQILGTKEAKDLGIEKMEDLAKKVSEGLQSKKESKATFALLKSPKFAEIMSGKAKEAGNTYSPQSVNSSPAPTTQKATAKPAPSTQPQPKTAHAQAHPAMSPKPPAGGKATNSAPTKATA